MRTTQTLLKQHIGWYFKKHWKIQGKRTPVITSAEKILKNAGFPVYKAEDIASDKKIEQIEENDNNNLGLLNKTHPNWHEKICYTYKDDNVLLEGLNQAKIITKTVEIKEGLPDNFTLKNATEDVHKKVKNIIFNSHLFDAETKTVNLKFKDQRKTSMELS
ncbi:uncharacterized protein LOC108743894 [Agrilus planipennis]|uniref:Uncharacterized protein LOC108743894 n=1 Tax=Agrilus planipennis TaxID=224129 RepID=A0A1W4XRG9_AGRPL|nr:uncharacterized protein LOC108743894 [Agrilus planipennis]